MSAIEAIPHGPISGPRHPALLAAVIISAGILTADHLDWSPSFWLIFGLISLSIVAALVTVRRWRTTILPPVAVIALLFCLGALRLSTETCNRPPPALTRLMSLRHPVEIDGRLTDTPRSRLSGWQASLEIQNVQTKSGSAPLSAFVLISSPRSLSGLRYGDRVRLTARLRAPSVRRNPGGFDYADFLFRQGIDGLARPTSPVTRIEEGAYSFSPSNLVEPARDWIRSIFTEYLAPTPRALILGFLIGETDQLPPKLYETVRNSGTLHLLAVSGANVWLIVGMALLVLRPLRTRRWLRTFILLAIVILFSFLTRNDPSVVRASIMVASILIGRLVYRPIAALNAVGLSGALILLVSPLQVFRPGFQLSFAAVIAIIVVAARTTRALPSRQHRWLRMLVTVSLSSIAATTATAPILACQFGTVPIAALPANLIMIPIASAAAYLGAALLACSAISSAVTMWVAHPMTWVLQLFVIVAEFFATLPHAVIAWPQPSLWAVANYFLILILILNWWHRYRWLRPMVRYAIALALLLSLSSLRTSDAQELVMVFPDLGNRRAAGIGHPNGDLIWLADDPGIDNDLRQWVIDPLLRVTFPNLESEKEMSWRRADSLPAEVTLQHEPTSGPQWIRHTTELDGRDDPKRVWADVFTWNADTVILIRDCPESVPDLDWIPPSPGNLVVLPASGPDYRIRDLIEHLAPASVIFYGSNSWASQPNEWLEAWEARFPNIEFWSTAWHGGIVLRLSASKISLGPTIAKTVWQDPDL